VQAGFFTAVPTGSRLVPTGLADVAIMEQVTTTGGYRRTQDQVAEPARSLARAAKS